MAEVNVLVVYYSATGSNYKMAKTAEQAAREAGAEARLRKVHELAPMEAIASNPAWKAHHEATRDVPEARLEDLEWADAFVFSVPTRFGNMSAQFKEFLDSAGSLWAEGKLANKVVTAMSSAANDHGGQEHTILSLYATMCHWGAIIVPPGYTDAAIFGAGGNPYGTSMTAGNEGVVPDNIREAVAHQTRRLVMVAGWVKEGLLAKIKA